MISVGGIRSGNSVTKTFSGALRTWPGIVDDQRLRLNALEEMRRGDVSEIERRILAQQHHIEGIERDVAPFAEREMVAGFVAHR